MHSKRKNNNIILRHVFPGNSRDPSNLDPPEKRAVMWQAEFRISAAGEFLGAYNLACLFKGRGGFCSIRPIKATCTALRCINLAIPLHGLYWLQFLLCNSNRFSFQWDFAWVQAFAGQLSQSNYVKSR